MNVPEKAVEAAAKALCDQDARSVVNGFDVLDAKVILEAAVPFIAAEALREAAEASLSGQRGPRVSRTWLRERADRIERGES